MASNRVLNPMLFETLRHEYKVEKKCETQFRLIKDLKIIKKIDGVKGSIEGSCHF